MRTGACGGEVRETLVLLDERVVVCLEVAVLIRTSWQDLGLELRDVFCNFGC